MRRNIWLAIGIFGFLLVGIAATWEDPALRNKMVTIFRGATADVAGTPGVVPRPAAGDQGKALLGNGTWGSVSGGIESPCAVNTTSSITGWPLSTTRGGTGRTGGAVESPLAIDTSTSITGILPAAKGGTGVTTGLSTRIESPLALDTSTSITGVLPMANGGKPAMLTQATNDLQIVQDAAGDTFTAGLGATGQVTLGGAYSGRDVAFSMDTDAAANSGTNVSIFRDVTNGTDTGNFLECLLGTRAVPGTSHVKFSAGTYSFDNRPCLQLSSPLVFGGRGGRTTLIADTRWVLPPNGTYIAVPNLTSGDAYTGIGGPLDSMGEPSGQIWVYSWKQGQKVVIGGTTAFSTTAPGNIVLDGVNGVAGAGDAGGNVVLFGGDHGGTGGTVEGSVTIFNANGTTKMAEFNESKIGFFAATPVAQQTGDIGTALVNYGLMTAVAPLYGEMYDYDNTDATVIAIANQYHAIATPLTGAVSGWTYQAGLTGTIASAATSDVGTTTTFTDVAHGLLTGEYITIVNTGVAAYNSNFLVTKLTDDTFKVTVAFDSDVTGSWQRGANLKAGAGSAGTYTLRWNITADAVAGTPEMKVEPVINVTHQDKAASQRNFSTGDDWGQLTGGCIVTVAAGDIIYFQVKNLDDDNDMLIKHMNLTLTKL